MQSQYYLRAALPSKGWVKDIDNAIRALVKKGLSLPRRTITSVLYVPKNQGGLGLFSVLDNWHIAMISQFFRCSNSSDPTVCGFARDQLIQTFLHRRRGIPEPSLEELSAFLNSEIAQVERSLSDVKSLWTEVRNSLSLTKLSAEIEQDKIVLMNDSEMITKPGTLNKYLCVFFKRHHLDSLFAVIYFAMFALLLLVVIIIDLYKIKHTFSSIRLTNLLVPTNRY